MKIVQASAKPSTYEAIKWENNEAEIRQFVNDDTKLHFRDDGLRIWNDDARDWIACPMFHWIVRDSKGILFPYSEVEFKNKFDSDE